MLQFYFLSILLNLIAGLIFLYATTGEGETSLQLSDSDDPFAESTASSSDFNPDTDDLDLSLGGDSPSEAASPKKAGGDGGLKALLVPFLDDKTFQLVVGILSVLTGLMKLLSPIQYDVPLVGDLVPSLAGIATGAVLLLDWYQTRSDVSLALPDSLQNIYTGGRKYLGIFCIIAACLHFIFPRVLFL